MTEAVATPASVFSYLNQLVSQYRLLDLQPMLDATGRLQTNQHLNVAVLGRFNAGKSSFLNDLLGRPILPVGVIPVTSVVTEMVHGPTESAQVIYKNGRPPLQIPIQEIDSFVSESRNPENALGVARVKLLLPEMHRYPSLRLVDTPGLESTLLHNSEAALSWSPNTDLALVAVAVDPPLTHHDLSLIEQLLRFTPNVSVLLTKMDLLDSAGQNEILNFVTSQLRKKFGDAITVFPYSMKAGCADLNCSSIEHWLLEFQDSFHQARSAAMSRKLSTLLTAARDYLRFALKSAQATEEDCQRLRSALLDGGQSAADLHLQLRLVAARALAASRPNIERHLRDHVSSDLNRKLADRLAEKFPEWRGSCAAALREFRGWLTREMLDDLAAISVRDYQLFLHPHHDAQRLSRTVIQSFRDRLSDQVYRIFGITLHTTETEIDLAPPALPDVSIGKIFNHDWRWLFSIVPASLIRSALLSNLSQKLQDEVLKNLSRFTTQWEVVICDAIRASEQEAHRRIDDLIATVQQLLSSDPQRPVNEIQAHLQRLQVEIDRLAASEESTHRP